MDDSGCSQCEGLIAESASHGSSFRQYWRELLNQPQFARNMDIAELMQRRFIGDLAAHIAEGESASKRVLEVGAGSAVATRRLAACYGSNFYALDIAPEALAVAAKAESAAGQSRVNYIVADVLENPFPDHSFDLVFSQGLIEHFADPSAILQAQARLLKPGGWLAVHVPQKYSLYTLYKHWRMRAGTWPPGWETEYSARELVRAGEALGLQLSHTDGYGSFAQMVAVHLLRDMVTMGALVEIVRAFEVLEQALHPKLRVLLCPNVCAYFRADA